MSSNVPQIILGVVSIMAIAGIVMITLSLINKKHHDIPDDPCVNGRFQPLHQNAADAIALMKNKTVQETYNTFYKEGQTVDLTELQYDTPSSTWGYCDCRDLGSGRIVGTGQTCQHELAKNDCSRIMGEHACLISADMAVPLLPKYNSSSYATTKHVCGCTKDYGWGNDDYLCSAKANSCNPTSTDKVIKPCESTSVINDFNQYVRCCCEGCEDCYNTITKTCECGQHPELCVPHKSEPDKIKDQGSQVFPEGWPGIRLVPQIVVDSTCSCPPNSTPLREYKKDKPQYITAVDEQGLTQTLSKYLICDPTWHDVFGYYGFGDGGKCSDGIRWNAHSNSYDCHCNTKCGEGLSGWGLTHTDNIPEHPYTCCQGKICPGTSPVHPCLQQHDYDNLDHEERQAYCGSHCKDTSLDMADDLGCYVKNGHNMCCPQCNGLYTTDTGDGPTQYCCNKDRPFSGECVLTNN